MAKSPMVSDPEITCTVCGWTLPLRVPKCKKCGKPAEVILAEYESALSRYRRYLFGYSRGYTEEQIVMGSQEAEFHFKRGKEAFQKGDISGAEQHFTDAVTLFRNFEETHHLADMAWYYLSKVQMAQNKFDDALRSIEAAIRISPDDVSFQQTEKYIRALAGKQRVG